MRELLSRIIFPMFILVCANLSKSQTSLSIEGGVGVSSYGHTYSQRVEDFTFSSPMNRLGYFNFLLKVGAIEMGLLVETEGLSSFSFEFERCSCRGTRNLRGSTKLGGEIRYYLDVGSTRIYPYGGITFTKVSFNPSGLRRVGAGHPLGYFPLSDNDYRAMATLSPPSLSGSLFLGVLYNLSRKFAVSMRLRYEAWLGREDLVVYDIRYYSPNYEYDLEVRNKGRGIHGLIGFRYNLNGYQNK